MKRKYQVVVDVETTFRTEVIAQSEREAKEKAIEYAYQDTFGCEATWSGGKVYESTLVNCWADMSDSELLESIKEITGAENPNHLMNHIIKAENTYQESK